MKPARWTCWLVVVIAATAAFGTPGAAAPPTVALLIDESLRQNDTALVGLLEAQLGADPNIRLVERQAVDLVLKEQELGLIFSPEGVANRVQVGRLLRADALLTLKAEDKALDITICETRSGLRLRVTLLPRVKPEEDVRAVQAELAAALAKLAQPITAVCAAPPFVSQDLSHRYDSLQAIYARLVEQTLLERPGVIVVELAEARALARESTLTDGKTPIRPLPLYFLGEFRHENLSGATEPYIKIVLRRDETKLAERSTQKTPPGPEAAAFVLKATGELLEETIGSAVRKPDPAAESRELAQRARVFEQIGEHADSLPLLDASLLLEPNQPALHLEAMTDAGVIAAQLYDPRADRAEFLRRGHIALDYSRQAREHLEQRLHQAPVDTAHKLKGVMEAYDRWYKIFFNAHQSNEAFKAECRQDRVEWRAMAAHFLDSKMRDGDLDTATLDSLSWLLWQKIDKEPLDDTIHFRLGILPFHRAFEKYGRDWLAHLLHEGFTAHDKETESYAAFLDAVEKDGGPEAEQLVSVARKQMSAEHHHRHGATTHPAAQTAASTQPQPADEITLAPIIPKAPVEDTRQSGQTLRPEMFWLPAGSVDLYIGRDGKDPALIAKEHGGFYEVVSLADIPRARFGQGCFDGRYAWLAIASPRAGRTGDPKVVVIDIAHRRIAAELNPQNGLPEMGITRIAALEPGRVLLASCFGKEKSRRSYLATLTLKDQGVVIDMILEARHQFNPSIDTVQRDDDPGLTFLPQLLYPLPGAAGQPPSRVLLFNQEGTQRPLIVDLHTRQARVLDGHIWPADFTCHGNAVYWSYQYENRPAILRFGGDDLRTTVVATGVEDDAKIAFFGGLIYVVGREWRVSDSFDKPFRKLRVNLPDTARPDLRQLTVSGQDGLLLRASPDEPAWYRVGLPPGNSTQP